MVLKMNNKWFALLNALKEAEYIIHNYTNNVKLTITHSKKSDIELDLGVEFEWYVIDNDTIEIKNATGMINDIRLKWQFIKGLTNIILSYENSSKVVTLKYKIY